MSAVWATGGVGRPRAAAFLVLAGLSAAAYEERRAARSGAIAVRLVEREKVTERVRTQLREPRWPNVSSGYSPPREHVVRS